MVKVIESLGTPNPDAKKFITDARLVPAGALSFEDAQAAKDNILAQALFNAGPVASLFLMDRFVTVTKFSGAEWTDLEPKLVETIQSQASPAEPAAESAPAGGDADTLAKINAVIDENVRPALADHHGGLEVIGYAGHVLSVRYEGECGSCPSSITGTLVAIQNLLQRMVDPRIEVASV